MILGIDFDGTLVEHQFPEIGTEVPGAFKWLRIFQDHGAKLVLWTMRSNSQKHGRVLGDAVDYCLAKGIKFWGINCNPEQHSWTGSPKAYCNFYIDDAAIGCPLVRPPGKRPYVCWEQVGPLVLDIIDTKVGPTLKGK